MHCELMILPYMYVCTIHVCMYHTCMYVPYMYVCTIHVCMHHTCMYGSVYECMYTHTHTRSLGNLCQSVACIHTYIIFFIITHSHVHTHTHAHAHTHTHTHALRATYVSLSNACPTVCLSPPCLAWRRSLTSAASALTMSFTALFTDVCMCCMCVCVCMRVCVKVYVFVYMHYAIHMCMCTVYIYFHIMHRHTHYTHTHAFRGYTHMPVSYMLVLHNDE